MASRRRAARDAYGNTSVPVAASQQQIRGLLIAAGSQGVQFTEEWSLGTIGFKFTKQKTLEPGPDGERRVIPLFVSMTIRLWRAPQDRVRASESIKAQRERQVWRALYWYLKSQFEAVAFGLRTFEDVFMSDVVMADGRTIGDYVRGQLMTGRLALPERIPAE